MFSTILTTLWIVAAISIIDANPRIRVRQSPPVQTHNKGPVTSDCCTNYHGLLQYFSQLSDQANELTNAADNLKIRIAEIQRLMPSSCARPARGEKGIPVRKRPDSWVPQPKSPRRPQPPSPTDSPRTCLDWLQRDGRARNGEMFAIDPYGRGRTVNVRCIFYDEHVVTEFGPSDQSQQSSYSVHSQNCYDRYDSIVSEKDVCERRDIAYGSLDRNDIYTIMGLSGTCSQRVTWGCHANNLLYLNGGRYINVYGVILRGEEEGLRQGVCACSVSQNCTDPSQPCHCSSKLDQWAMDDIVISGGANNVNLPIYEVIVGDIAGTREAANVIVHAVQCVQPLELSGAGSRSQQSAESSIDETKPKPEAESEITFKAEAEEES